MSKQIAQTVGDKRVAVLIAILAMFAVLATVATQWRTSSAQDPPSVSLTKVCGPSDQANITLCTITVRNLTPLQASETEEGSDVFEPHYTPPGELLDILPDIGDWNILSAYVYDEPGNPIATLDCSAASGNFVCEIPPLIGRHLNNDETDFESGFAEIVTYGVLNECGVDTNTVILTGTVLFRSTAADIGAPCATATPTNSPTSAPNTPTSVPPTATATATLSDPVPTATATPIRIAPRPPNTGDSGGSDLSQGGDATAYWLYAALGLGAIAFAVGGTAVARRSR